MTQAIGVKRRSRKRAVPTSRALHALAWLPAHVLVWAYAALLIIPLYFLVVSSFKTNIEIFTDGFGLPSSWDFQYYINAWNYIDLGSGLLNSAIITIAAGVFTVLVTVPASYAIARSRGLVGRLIERSMVLGFLIPGFAAIVPTVFLAIWMGLYQTRVFLVLDYVGTAIPFTVLILTQYMRAIPPELDECATVDGANRLQILIRIYLPLVVPALTTVMLINFINFWNEYLVALIIVGSGDSVRTAQVALPLLSSAKDPRYGLLTAATVITLLPIYLAYFFMRKKMEEALVSGATKG